MHKNTEIEPIKPGNFEVCNSGSDVGRTAFGPNSKANIHHLINIKMIYQHYGIIDIFYDDLRNGSLLFRLGIIAGPNHHSNWG